MSERIDPSIAFYEEQQMREPLIVAPIVIGDILTLAFAAIAPSYFHQQALTIPLFSVMFVIAVAQCWFMFGAKMITEVRDDGILVRGNLMARLRRSIPFDQVVKCEAREYNPLREYGGWGIKKGPRGTAYNMMGKRGVQLELASGEKLLIGSQKADELATLIQARRK